MKRVVFAPAALASFDDILRYTIDQFGETQADNYTVQIITRLDELASGTGPKARPCDVLMRGVRDAAGLTYYRVGMHFLILRESADTLEVVEILHARMDLEGHLRRLMGKDEG